MRAEVISIGTELLLGQITDTNATELATFLAECGIACTHRQTVGDNLDRIVEALKLARDRSDIIFTIGGLGPTPDDLTRQAIALLFGEPLFEDPELVEFLQKQYGRRGLKMTPSQFLQAQRISSSQSLSNVNGTAPGLFAFQGHLKLFALPGPKNEFNAMLRGPVFEIISQLGNGEKFYSRTLRVCGISEAIIGEKLAHLMDQSDPTVAPYAKTGEVHLRITTRTQSQSEADPILDSTAKEIYKILGSHIYAEGDTTLEDWIVNKLKLDGKTLSTVESCTSGLLGGRITNVNGASNVYKMGWITYSAQSKIQLVGVSHGTIENFGTVSEIAAKEMAEGARANAQSDYALSITGVAGSEDLDEPPYLKPSGLIFLGIASPFATKVYQFELRGDRPTIKDRAVSLALIRFRDQLLSELE